VVIIAPIVAVIKPLEEKFCLESIMVVKAFDKCGDGFIAVDVGDGHPHFQTAADVVTNSCLDSL
jgi:hypothetical protein